MHHLFFRLFLFALLLWGSACFEVIEEVNLHPDGSGDFSYTLNASQSKVKLKSIMLLDSINGYRVPSRAEIESDLREFQRSLSQKPGLSNVVITQDHESFIYSVKASFRSIDQLNLALNQVAQEQVNKHPKAPTFIPFDNYQYNGKTFTRLAPREDRSQQYYQASPENREVIDQAQAIGIYRFDQPVLSASHPQARISPNGKAVMIRASVKDLILQRVPLYNQIRLQ